MFSFKTIRRKVKYTLLYFFVKGLIGVANVVPRRWWLSFCGFLGNIAGHLAVHYRKLAVKHLTIAFGHEKSKKEIEDLSYQTFVMLGKNVGDVLRAVNVDSLEKLEKFVKMKGMEHFKAADSKGKGVVFVACHLGAFELQITSMAVRKFNFMVIGTALKDKRLNDLMWKHRNKNGTNAVDRNKATFPMLKVLKSGGSVALLIDQDTNKVKGTFVEFFGRTAYTPVGAALLALKTGAAVLPAFSHLGDDGFQHIEILPEIPLHITGNEEEDIRHNTQVFTRFIEERIRKYPAQWLWMHERWKTQPTPVTQDVQLTN
jgi:Kdo2-lipid IVA lauroyltransferase/acyltransferase